MSEKIKEFFDKELFDNDQTFHRVDTFKVIHDKNTKEIFLGFGEWIDRDDLEGRPESGVLVKTQIRFSVDMVPSLAKSMLEVLQLDRKNDLLSNKEGEE